jgi:cytochrome bd-type quinol oxidase subunit 2
MAESQSSNYGAGRRWLWTSLACLLAVVILVTAWLPGRATDWSRAAILMLLLALAAEWLVLHRVYHHQQHASRRRNVVRVIMSVLLGVSAIILAVSSRRQ